MQPGVRGGHRFRAHVEIEESRTAAAKILCAIHRRIRVAHEVVNRRAIVREQSDADACAHEVIASTYIYRQSQRVDDAVSHGTRRVGICDVTQDDSEFIAPQPGNGVAILHARTQALRHDRQHLIACNVPHRIVYSLEMVQIDIQKRATAQARTCVGNFLRQSIAKENAVRQRRERVIVSLSVQALIVSTLRQRDCESLGELAAVASEMWVGGGRLAITDRENGFDSIGHDDRPHPEEIGADFLERPEEAVP